MAILRLRQSLLVLAIALLSAPIALAVEEGEPETEQASQDGREEVGSDIDGTIDDAVGSIEEAVEERGLETGGDIRVGLSYSDLEDRDGTEEDDGLGRARWRVQVSWGILDNLRFKARVAGLCSTEECAPNFVIEDSIPTSNSMADGDITLDEFLLHGYQTDRFDVAIGRMQTKFVARGGVFAKSLDRNDSHNVTVNWTDGFHGTYRARNGWVSHLILQYNSKDGATNVRRDPLNFDDRDARTTAFVAFESLRRRGALLQRAFDVSYLPESLLKDGTVSGRREDYVGLVLRGAARFPNRSAGKRLRFSGEVGYAPETQTNASAGLPGAGDVDGWAWNFTASFMDFAPDHSIGINYAQTDAGWLISPQYRNNDELFEIQYQWRRTVDLAIDVRVRWRRELEKLTTALQKREEVDAFVRFTWGFTLKR